MVVTKDSEFLSYGCTALPTKGVTEYSVAYMVGYIRGPGFKRVLWRGDNEPALLAQRAAISLTMPEVEFVPRDAPEGDHAANGFAESAARELKAEVRVPKSSLEEKIGARLPSDDPLLAWLPRFAANMRNNVAPAGRRWRKPIVHFGERIMHRPMKVGKKRKDDYGPHMPEGLYVGHHERTSAHDGADGKGPPARQGAHEGAPRPALDP